MPKAYYLQLPLTFPEGVHFGGNDNYNSLLIARDGRGCPVLNGSSLAGMLRSLWTDFHMASLYDTTDKSAYELAELRKKVQSRVCDMFGDALGADAKSESADRYSCVKVSNYLLHTGSTRLHESEDALEQRVFHLRNRHRGSVVNQGLFSIEACPPGTSATVGLWILDHNRVSESEIELFIDVAVGAFANGVHLGGNSNRGFGRALVDEANVRMQRFDLAKLEQHATYLDAHREWRQFGKVARAEEYIAVNSNNTPDSLLVEVILQIPKGQDLLMASGRANEVNAEPQYVANTNGNKQWRLPGSSLRGLFCRWFHRLDARERLANGEFELIDRGDAAMDYHQRETNCEYTPQGRASCFHNADQQTSFVVPAAWRVTSLFGSCYHPGRIKISDGYASCSGTDPEKCREVQKRVHVAVDRVTGGAAEGFLFDNRVLTSAKSTVCFPIRIVIRQPREFEARWLAQTLIALHLGVLRVGSSKSAGRLEIKEVSAVRGPQSEVFRQILKSIGK